MSDDEAVTKKELADAFEAFEARFEAEFGSRAPLRGPPMTQAEFDIAIRKLVTKEEQAQWLSEVYKAIQDDRASIARIERRLAELPTKADLDRRFAETNADMARYIDAAYERSRADTNAVAEQLEAGVDKVANDLETHRADGTVHRR